MSTTTANLDQLAINTIRTLSMDAVQEANSGHPGTPMALAPVAFSLWQNVMNFDPEHAQWPARDRFVLSCGHASMLLYSCLHLAGVKSLDEDGEPLDSPSISLQNIKDFRQMGSPCAGHPEYGDAAGIETTTGPLGQGIANSVGMAMAAKWFAARYNRPKFELFDYNVYALCSDGDVMEGIGCEAASLAGHLGLSNLCWIYDDNNITIEGDTDLAFTEDVGARFAASGWNVEVVEDANDLDAIQKAIDAFQAETKRPTLIVLKSIIAWGAPNKQNTHGAHGSPLGHDEIRLTKQAYGWPENEKFLVPKEVMEYFQKGLGKRGRAAYETWQDQFADYEKQFPTEAKELKLAWAGKLPENWSQEIPVFEANEKGVATRVSSGQVINALANQIPFMIGGSADLAPSNNTMLKDEKSGHFEADSFGGRNLHFGIREHAMAAISNGLSLSGIRPYCATFFVFTDYLRPSMRLSSIMHQNVIYVLTHDSIGLGEDGPTHQPVEHLSACRAIPGLHVMRPADANEVAECYKAAMQLKGHPTAMVLTRQALPTVDRTKFGAVSGTAKGGYILAEAEGGDAKVILMSTGSEVAICLAARETLQGQGIPTRVVSLPCFELFEKQPKAYQEEVFPPSVTARVAVEAGIRQCWDRYLGFDGQFVGMNSFGASAPYQELYERFGITAKGVVEAAKKSLG